MAVGALIVKWYDRKGFYRIQPDLLGYLNTAGQHYKSEQATPTPVASETTQPARGTPSSQQPRQADQEQYPSPQDAARI